MAIEIYDKGAKIIKGDTTYFFLKFGSKNSFTCGGQSRLDNNFRAQWLKRDCRDSTWHVIAYGKNGCSLDNTYWNASTGMVYGRISFGDNKNIAYSLDKMRVKDISEYDDGQQYHINDRIEYAINGRGKEYTIDLDNIPNEKKFRAIDTYCGKEVPFMEGINAKSFNGKIYWNLDNL